LNPFSDSNATAAELSSALFILKRMSSASNEKTNDLSGKGSWLTATSSAAVLGGCGG